MVPTDTVREVLGARPGEAPPFSPHKCLACRSLSRWAKLLDLADLLGIRIAVAKVGGHPQPVRRGGSGRIGHGHLKLEGRVVDVIAVRVAGPDEVPVPVPGVRV